MSRLQDYSDTELAKLIEDDRVARAVLNRLAGLRAEAARVPDDAIGEDQAVRRAAPALLSVCKKFVKAEPLWLPVATGAEDEGDLNEIKALQDLDCELRRVIAQAENKA